MSPEAVVIRIDAIAALTLILGLLCVAAFMAVAGSIKQGDGDGWICACVVGWFGVAGISVVFVVQVAAHGLITKITHPEVYVEAEACPESAHGKDGSEQSPEH